MALVTYLKALPLILLATAAQAGNGNSSGGGSPPPPMAVTYYVAGADGGDSATLASLSGIRSAAAQLLVDGVIAEIRVGHRVGGHVSSPTKEPAICLAFTSYQGLQSANALEVLPEGVEQTHSMDCRGVTSAIPDFGMGGEPGQTVETNEPPKPEAMAIDAFKADPAVLARLGALTGSEEFDAVLLSSGGELPHGTHTPIYFSTYLVVSRVQAYTPHGFYQTNVFAKVHFSHGEPSSVQLVDLAHGSR